MQAEETLWTLGRRQNLKQSGHLDGKFSAPPPVLKELWEFPTSPTDLAYRPCMCMCMYVLPCNVAKNTPKPDK